MAGDQKSAAEGEAAILARFAPEDNDAAGLIAFALHRKAYLAFRAEFHTRLGREPDDAEMAAFLVGETSEARIAAYRATARTMLGRPVEAANPVSPTEKPKPARKRAKLPWFGSWVDSPLAPEKPEDINWRGLLVRLLVLLLAVIATAILLRVLFVRV